MELQFTQNHLEHPEQNALSMLRFINEKPWKHNQFGESQKLSFGLDMGQF